MKLINKHVVKFDSIVLNPHHEISHFQVTVHSHFLASVIQAYIFKSK